MSELLMDYSPDDNSSGVVSADVPITHLDPDVPPGSETFDGGDPRNLLAGIPQPGIGGAGMVRARTQTGGHYKTTATLAGPNDERTEWPGRSE